MRNLAQQIRKEDGLTLVELLAAIALSGLILLLVSTILTTSLFAFGRINHETELRNKAVTLSATLQAKLKNTVRIADGPLDQIRAEVLTDVLSGVTEPVTLQLKEGNLYMNDSMMHDEDLSLADSYFTQDSKGLQLHLQFRLADEPKVEPLYLFVSIKFIS
ncbi:PulJ/GspJ family protein [Paenibacillus aceti]|uniref:Prepilin-type N-terminal cleavage/methylation domain-containing protein n=1 Tax=Paenibacillus aceti TaxID=1820010 RepID=A0ABQ1VXQ4_9BACL|nr:prepilin-type N-terminal cleavage/methylation domain-containing protein [Paenibacillus aceti]GGG04672.1 hypothetical protein GCM10010913_28130 [Paenibacillus aceti]